MCHQICRLQNGFTHQLYENFEADVCAAGHPTMLAKMEIGNADVANFLIDSAKVFFLLFLLLLFLLSDCESNSDSSGVTGPGPGHGVNIEL